MQGQGLSHDAAQSRSSWPRANLQQLLRMDSSDSTAQSDNNSCSHDRDAAATAESCSPHAVMQQQPSVQSSAGEHPAGSEDSPPLHQQQTDASRFSFVGEGQQAVPLQYITPLKIPQPPNKALGRVGASTPAGQHADGSSSRSSSPAGSYMQNLHQRAQHKEQDMAGDNCMTHAAARASQHVKATRGVGPGSNPGSSPCSRLPTPSAASSMSSEAAALLQALRLAAEQRRITQGVLTARSSLTSGLAADMAPPCAEQHTPTSTLQLAAAVAGGSTPARLSTGDNKHAATACEHPQAAAAAAAAGFGPRQHSVSPRSSPQASVHGPLGPMPRSSSVLLLQRTAAERLLQDALDSSSFSSLMALLDSAAGSEDEDEVQQPQHQEQQHVEMQQGQQGALQHQPQQAGLQSGSNPRKHQQQLQQAPAAGESRCKPPLPGPAASGMGTLAGAGGASIKHAARAAVEAVSAGPWGGNASHGVQPQAVSRRTSAVDSNSAWGSCFSTPLGGNSAVHTPRGDAHADRRQSSTTEGQHGHAALRQEPVQTMQEGCSKSGVQHDLQQQQQEKEDNMQLPHGAGVSAGGQHPSPPLSSNVSWAASELVSEALSRELEQLHRQVEQEKQQLQHLQQQRSQLEQGLEAVPQAQPLEQHTQPLSTNGDSRGSMQQAVASAGAPQSNADGLAAVVTAHAHAEQGHDAEPPEVSPQSVYLDCCSEQLLPEGQQEQQDPGATDRTAADADGTLAGAVMVDAAVQPDSSWLHEQQQEPVQEVDAECQAVLLHVSGLPAVGPPIECRACPLVQKQLQETHRRLEAALEQQKQVWCLS